MSSILAPEDDTLTTVLLRLLIRAGLTRSVIEVPKMTQIFSFGQGFSALLVNFEEFMCDGKGEYPHSTGLDILDESIGGFLAIGFCDMAGGAGGGDLRLKGVDPVG